MAVYGVWLINKSGGLIYQKDFSNQNQNVTPNQNNVTLPKLSTNEYLVLASTFQR
jgi:hypothetical protein